MQRPEILPGTWQIQMSCMDPRTRARILQHFKVTAEKIALGKVNFSKGILKQPDFSLTAVCHCCQETYSLATGLNAAVLVTLLERQLVCLKGLSHEIEMG